MTLPGVGEAKDRVECAFTPSSFDLKVSVFCWLVVACVVVWDDASEAP